MRDWIAGMGCDCVAQCQGTRVRKLLKRRTGGGPGNNNRKDVCFCCVVVKERVVKRIFPTEEWRMEH